MCATGPVVGIIPARLESTRLPGKLLLRETGVPLLQYAWEQASASRRLQRVLIATDSERIAQVANGFGAQVIMTGQHPSGTDRVAEAARLACPDAALIVNLQGDEPELDAGQIDLLVDVMQNTPGAGMGTLATPITDAERVQAPSCVKVVCAADGRALYFSRSPVPFVRDQSISDVLSSVNATPNGAGSPWLLHVGIYAYRANVLQQFTTWHPSPLERLEQLEQLRALEHNVVIQVVRVEHHSVGIDTPDDYAAFVARATRRGIA